jgi:hypothetical protein
LRNADANAAESVYDGPTFVGCWRLHALADCLGAMTLENYEQPSS